MMSAVLPGASGTSNLIGFEGQDCANACVATSEAAIKA
jgi:hypothetical protein